MSNVKVVVRFRPLNAFEKQQSSSSIVEFSKDNKSVALQGYPSVFTFDRCYDGETTQAKLYHDIGKPVVEDVMQGFNGTIFAYGQTSCGKTYTMEGPDIDSPHSRGIVPRLCTDVFKYIVTAPATLEFTVKVSYIEIYLETIRDLLDDSKMHLQIHEDRQKGIFVKGVSEVYVSCAEEVLALVKKGAKNRQVAHTDMNEESSRSHAVFQLVVQQKDLIENTYKTGKISLIDLAGSEKVSRARPTGSSMEETKKINRSLSALGNVIHALTDGKSKHIPYRDSKLTRILQESLGGNSRTTIIINCSPSPSNHSETLSSLRFGSRAKNIKNKARVNLQLSVDELLKQLVMLRRQMKAQETELKKYRVGTGRPAAGHTTSPRLITPISLAYESNVYSRSETDIVDSQPVRDQSDDDFNSASSLAERLAEKETLAESLLCENKSLQEEVTRLKRQAESADALRSELEEVREANQTLTLENKQKTTMVDELMEQIKVQTAEHVRLRTLIDMKETTTEMPLAESKSPDIEPMEVVQQQLANAVEERDKLSLKNCDLNERLKGLTDDFSEYLEQILGCERKMLQEIGQEDLLRQIKTHVDRTMVSRDQYTNEVQYLREHIDRLRCQLEAMEKAHRVAEEFMQENRLDQCKKTKFLEISVEALGRVHQQLLEQNSQTKLRLCLAEQRLHQKRENVKTLEKKILEMEEMQTQEELNYRFTVARLESTVASLQQQIASSQGEAAPAITANIAKPIRGQGSKGGATVGRHRSSDAVPMMFWSKNDKKEIVEEDM